MCLFCGISEDCYAYLSLQKECLFSNLSLISNLSHLDVWVELLQLLLAKTDAIQLRIPMDIFLVDEELASQIFEIWRRCWPKNQFFAAGKHDVFSYLNA